MATSIIRNVANEYVEAPHTETSNLICYGWITNSATELHIVVKSSRLLTRISSITVTALTLSAKLFTGTSLSGDVFSDSSKVVANVAGKEIHITLTKKNSGTWGSNNVHFVGNVSNFTFTLR